MAAVGCLLLAFFFSTKNVDGGWDGPAGGCPVNSCRASALIFSCSGAATSQARVYLPPNAITEVGDIAAGIRFFAVTATSNVDTVELRLFDHFLNKYVVAEDEDASVNNHHGFGSLDDLGIVFSRSLNDTSTSLRVSPKITETLVLVGSPPRDLGLRFRNRGPAGSTVGLKYSYKGNEACPQIPKGCDSYNRTEAWADVIQWSRSLQVAYPTAEAAFDSICGPRAGARSAAEVVVSSAVLAEGDDGCGMSEGFAWHQWPAIWKLADDSLAGRVFQGFRFLDVDNDEVVSKTEFKVGFDMHGSASTVVVASRETIVGESTIARIWRGLTQLGQPEDFVKLSIIFASVALVVPFMCCLTCWFFSATRVPARTVISRPFADGHSDDEDFTESKCYKIRNSIDHTRPAAKVVSEYNDVVPVITPPQPIFANPAAAAVGVWRGLWPDMGPLLPTRNNSFRYGPLASMEEPTPEGIGGMPRQIIAGDFARSGSFMPSPSFSGHPPVNPCTPQPPFGGGLQHTGSFVPPPQMGHPPPLPNQGSFTDNQPGHSAFMPALHNLAVPTPYNQTLPPPDLYAPMPPDLYASMHAVPAQNWGGGGSSFEVPVSASVAGPSVEVPVSVSVAVPVESARRPANLHLEAQHGEADSPESKVEAIKEAFRKQAPWATVYTPEEWARKQHPEKPTAIPLLQLQT